MNVEINKTYLSNNSEFPDQMFHVLSVKESKRFSKDNAIIEYERWAFDSKSNLYLVSTDTNWLYNADKCILGPQFPEKFEKKFRLEAKKS